MGLTYLILCADWRCCRLEVGLLSAFCCGAIKQSYHNAQYNVINVSRRASDYSVGVLQVFYVLNEIRKCFLNSF